MQVFVVGVFFHPVAVTVDDKTHTAIKSHNGHTLQCKTTGLRNRNVTFRTWTEVIALT